MIPAEEWWYAKGANTTPTLRRRGTGSTAGPVTRGGVLCGEGNGSCPREGAGELRQDGEVGVKLDALKATNAKRQRDHSCLNLPNSRSTEARRW
jgi:hypothetical protein